MRRCLILIVVLAIGPVGAGAALPLLIDASEVQPGAHGVCLTEMDGGEMVEVPLTVIGTLGATAPEGEIVLVRLHSERFEHTGIIAGMSGSPVYIGDRLLGALAFGWTFSKDPIGGVTPFRRMATLGQDVPAGSPAGASGRPDALAILEASRSGELGQLLLDWLLPSAEGELHRLPLAVSLAGAMPPTGGGWLASAWSRLGFVDAPGGGSGEATGPIVPGAMVAGVLADGDISLSAAGTVTAVDGDEVWAFGHPFLSGGSVSFPLARANVLAVLPSQLNSFKFFNVGQTVGAFRMDRAHGVWGRLGETAPMVPLEVVTAGESYSFRCVHHPVMLPLLVSYLTQASHSVRGRSFGAQTLVITASVRYSGGHEATIEGTYSEANAVELAAGLAGALVAYLENSSFDIPRIEGVRIEMRSQGSIERTEILDAVPVRATVRPGETLEVRLRLRPYRGAEESRSIMVDVPRELPAGRVDLIVADGGSWTEYDFRMRPPSPASFADELRLIDRIRPASEVVVALERRDAGAALSGGTVAMPPSVLLAMRAGLGPNLEATSHRVVSSTWTQMSAPTVGARRIPLKVRRDGVATESSAMETR